MSRRSLRAELDRNPEGGGLMDSGNNHQASAAQDSGKADLLREAILDALSYPTQDDRESQIVETHSNTYAWILNPAKHPFAQWLVESTLSAPLGSAGDPGSAVGNSNLYWITGHPGSGKSTLMQHIRHSPQLPRSVKLWMPHEKVTIASFYFWESGSVMQRSRQGLLRSILHQLLEPKTRLMSQVMPDLWAFLMHASTLERVRKLSEWDEDELIEALRRYFALTDRPPTFMMIDGLDEFDGDMLELVKLLKDLAAGQKVKICVSSRPWPVFLETLENVPMLRLQELTEGDMKAYIRDRLWKPLQCLGEEPERRKVEAEMLRRADGVFLWITFAVAELIGHSTGSPSIPAIRASVEQLPAGLYEFIQYKLLRQSPEPREVSRVFQLMRARQEVGAFSGDDDGSTVSLWELSLARQVMSSEQLADVPIYQVPQTEVEAICRDTKDYLKTATQSLVVVSTAKDHSVNPLRSLTYIHRTVKDWAQQSTMWPKILSLAPDVHPHLELLRVVVQSFRSSLEKPWRTRRILVWWSQIVLIMTHARYVSADPAISEEMFDLLDLFNETLEWYYFPQRNQDPRIDHWARTCFGTLESRGNTPYEDPFLSLVIRCGVGEYVKRYLAEERYQPGDGHSVIGWGVMYLVNRQKTLYPLSDQDVVRSLLEAGLDCNHKYKPPGTKKMLSSPWEMALEAVQQGSRRQWIQALDENEMERLCAIVEMFLDHGADRAVRISATHKDRTESLTDLLARVLAACPCRAVERLVGKVALSGA